MIPTISIRPSKDLRTNYSKISELSRDHPVAITVNGKEDTIILSHEAYIDQLKYISELEARLEAYRHLATAVDDIKLGRVEDMDSACNDILAELDSLEL